MSAHGRTHQASKLMWEETWLKPSPIHLRGGSPREQVGK